MKKKMIAFVLAALLVCAMAVPVSAATTLSVDVTYDSCNFYIYANIGRHSIHNLIEGGYFPNGKSYEDYIMCTSCIYHVLDSEGLIIYGGYIHSVESTRITSLGRTIENPIYSTQNGFYINNESIYPSTYLCNY